MGDQIFIIDANTLIAPYRIYYPFDIAPSFWEQMKGKILDGSVVILTWFTTRSWQGMTS